MQHPGWPLIVIGVLIAGIGLIWLLVPSIPWLGKLPGDIRIEGENTRTRTVPISRAGAGLLMYRKRSGSIQVLLAHPGGPFFRNRDEGAWSIPKGEIEPDEDLLEAAQREFEEETGVVPTGPFVDLMPVRQKGGKIVHAWAIEGDCDPAATVSNTFTMEWPPRSGQQVEFPEIDRAEFFDLDTAKRKINAAQVSLIEKLEELLKGE